MPLLHVTSKISKTLKKCFPMCRVHLVNYSCLWKVNTPFDVENCRIQHCLIYIDPQFSSIFSLKTMSFSKIVAMTFLHFEIFRQERWVENFNSISLTRCQWTKKQVTTIYTACVQFGTAFSTSKPYAACSLKLRPVKLLLVIFGHFKK